MERFELRHSTYDVVIIGARCAGAALAIELAHGGLRVLAVDRATAGSDTLSTHALMRPAVELLARWGVLDAVRREAPGIRASRFVYGDEATEVEIEPRGEVDALYAPRRNLLDAILARAARDAGAEVAHQVSLRALRRAAMAASWAWSSRTRSVDATPCPARSSSGPTARARPSRGSWARRRARAGRTPRPTCTRTCRTMAA